MTRPFANKRANNTGAIWLAAGGTGGHVFPAIHTADALTSRGFDVFMITDKRGVRLLPAEMKRAVIAAASPFAGSLFSRLFALVKLFAGFIQILALLLARRPQALVGFGGYPAAAPTLAAWLLRIPVWLHEQNAVMGRTNQMLAKLARQVFTSWPETTGLPQTARHLHTGLPVGKAFTALPPYQPGKDDGPLHLAVFGGSLGARLFADILPLAVAQLPDQLKQSVKITQQAREDQIAVLKAAYAAQAITADIRPFFADVAGVMASADLIICRAGASTVAELAAAGRPSLLIPFAHALDDHQQANARQLANTGGAELVTEQDASDQHLAKLITDLLSAPDRRQTQARAARTIARPDADKQICTVLETHLFSPSQEAA